MYDVTVTAIFLLELAGIELISQSSKTKKMRLTLIKHWKFKFDFITNISILLYRSFYFSLPFFFISSFLPTARYRLF